MGVQVFWKSFILKEITILYEDKHNLNNNPSYMYLIYNVLISLAEMI